MDIKELLKEKGELIDEYLEEVFPKESNQNHISNLYDVIWYHMGTGGKRIRPALAITTCEALGGKTEQVLPFAAACEVLHNWLLIHDDIEDGDQMRRDQPAAWVKYGVHHAINVGDVMAQKALELILKSKEKGVDNETIFLLTKSIIDTAIKTGEGQTLEFNLRVNSNPTEEEYLEMIRKKTAYYLTVPMVGGALIAGADEDTIKAIRKFGMYIGPIFQIVDDVIDLTMGKGRGELGCDIKEGKRSLLVVHCLNKCINEEKTRLLYILNKPREETTKEDIDYAKMLFDKYGSIQYCQEKIKDLSSQAKETISNLDPRLREILEAFSDFLVKRDK